MCNHTPPPSSPAPECTGRISVRLCCYRPRLGLLQLRSHSNPLSAGHSRPAIAESSTRPYACSTERTTGGGDGGHATGAHSGATRGRKTGALRKTPLMKVVGGANYVLVASRGGAPTHPLWYHNLKADPNVEHRDGGQVYAMRVRQVEDSVQRQRLWDIAVVA